MINVTNDAWFGSSAGPYQHFHQARVRAVEQGLPLVRAANTGISAMIDPYGRIRRRDRPRREGCIDSELPRAVPADDVRHAGIRIEISVILLALAGWLACRLQPIRSMS